MLQTTDMRAPNFDWAQYVRAFDAALAEHHARIEAGRTPDPELAHAAALDLEAVRLAIEVAAAHEDALAIERRRERHVTEVAQRVHAVLRLTQPQPRRHYHHR